MQTLHVLYDGQCALCHTCRRWLERQPAYVHLHFVDLHSPEAACRFPGIDRFHPEQALLAVSDTGDVYQGSHAWIMCLWALREYREWSQWLADPALLPLARRVCELVSTNRLSISDWLRRDDRAFTRTVMAQPSSACAEGNCPRG